MRQKEKIPNQKFTVKKRDYKRGVSIGLAFFFVCCTPVFMEYKVGTNRGYNLSLAAKQRFGTIILTAHLTFSQGFFRTEAVDGAIIHFYRCNSAGRNQSEIGQNVTRRDGAATFLWSAPGNGNYWFIAAYVVSTTGGKIMVTS